MIEVRHCRKAYSGRILFDRLSFKVPAGETLQIVGPSGAGKTTLLRLVAGLDRPDAGDILLRGQPARGLSLSRRRLGYAFQDDLLWPHLTVHGHLDYALSSWPRADREARIRELLHALGLAPLARARPPQLSGGEARRLNLARACAARRDILLFDEPFAHLDGALSERVRDWLREESRHAACLLVTHDADDRLKLGSAKLHLPQQNLEPNA